MICLLSPIYLFIYVYIYLITCLDQYGLIDIYFIFWILIQYCIIYFGAQIVPALAIGISFS